jgi:hypothetical protein
LNQWVGLAVPVDWKRPIISMEVLGYYPGNSNMGKRQLETLKDSKFGLFQSTGTASPTHWFNPGHIYGRYPGTRKL